jgi:hypothetical protein
VGNESPFEVGPIGGWEKDDKVLSFGIWLKYTPRDFS